MKSNFDRRTEPSFTFVKFLSTTLRSKFYFSALSCTSQSEAKSSEETFIFDGNVNAVYEAKDNYFFSLNKVSSILYRVNVHLISSLNFNRI